MIQKLKAKANSKKGFTLAELLVVVGIIAILVAIAIPIFTAATTRATNAVIVANGRACKAEAMSDYISNGYTTGEQSYYYTISQDGTFAKGTADSDCPSKGWVYKVVVKGNTTTVTYGTTGKASGAATPLPALAAPSGD